MFKILLVCTGNVCRSPFAERVLQHWLDVDAPAEFEVRSAGLRAQVGEPMQPPSAELAAGHGADPTGFVSRQLDTAMLTGADAVLTMTRDQRSRVFEMVPALLRRTFTVRELARAATRFDAAAMRSGPGARWTALAAAAARERGAHAPDDVVQDDVVDPYRRGDEVYEQMARELVPALEILRWFGRGEPVGVLDPIEVPEPEPEARPRRSWWRRG